MTDSNLEQLFGLQSTTVTFDQKQEEAIAAACDPSRRVVAITGPAGTGKTLLMKEINRRLSEAGYTTQASAPTGKAAKRIKEITGLPAMTNHRMLGYAMPFEIEETDERGTRKIIQMSSGPRFTRERPLEEDFLLCDEYAMVNTTIHRELIDALKVGARIRMFGDVNQLKPIEDDDWRTNARKNVQLSPFQLALEKFGGITLDKIHRTEEGSGVAENAAAILKGRMPRKLPDFDVRITNNPVADLQDFIMEQLDAGIDFSSLDCQIITTMNKSWVGTKKLNPLVQGLFWDREKPPMDLPRHVYFRKEEKHTDDPAFIRVQVGSKVVFTANCYDLGVFNGEVGTVTELDHHLGAVTIDFGDREVQIPPVLVIMENNRPERSSGHHGARWNEKKAISEVDPRKWIDLAYVMTTHKCQGSEYRNVCVVLNKSTKWVQSRRNFYTSCTRARKHCTVLSDMVSLSYSVRNVE